MLNAKTKVDKLQASKQSTGAKAATECQSQHPHTKSQASCELGVLAVDGDFCRAHSSHSSDGFKHLTVKAESTHEEKLSKKDAANIVIRQLTPYYKNQRFGSKVYVQ